MEIKDRLKYVRKDLRMSQEEFGKKVGLSQSQIACYETGYRELPERSLDAICKEHNINKKWMLTGNGDIYTVSKEDVELMKTVARITSTDNQKLKEVVIQIRIILFYLKY